MFSLLVGRGESFGAWMRCATHRLASMVSRRWSLGDGLSRVRVLKLIKVPADGDLLHQLCIDNVSAFQVFT